MKQKIFSLFHVCRIIIERFFLDRLAYSASALTFTTLLALVPLITVSISILSAFPVFDALSSGVQQFIFQNFIPASGEVIQKYLFDFVTQAGKMSLVGTIFLVVTAVMMMLTIEGAFNNIWKVAQRRIGLAAFLRYWAILSLAPIFVAISIAATTYVMSLPFVIGTATYFGIQKTLASMIPMLLTLVAFALLYVSVPNCKVSWRHGLMGALIATILLQIAKRWFVVYITHIPTYQHIYGALAVMPIFLLWLYLIWVIILFGALVSNVLATHYYARKGGVIDGFTHAFLWLGHLWIAQQRGRGLSLSMLHRLVPASYDVDASTQLRCLLKLKLIQPTNYNTYILSRDFSQLSLADLYQLLPWKFPIETDQPLFPTSLKKIVEQFNQTTHKRLGFPLCKLYEDFFDHKK